MADEVTAIDQERCTYHPPLPPGRKRLECRVLSHDRRRVAWHYFGHTDYARLMLANDAIGLLGAPFSGLFGSPNAAPHLAFLHSARIINFPRRATSDIAKLRVEVEQIKRTLGTWPAGEKREVVGV